MVLELESLSDLMEDELKGLYSAESQLLIALPKLAKKASSSQLKAAFTGHLKETEGHVKRLQQIGKILGMELGGEKCQAMEGLVKEGGQALEAEGPPAIIDSALISAARRVEHYEMAAYCSTRGMAVELGKHEVAKLLEQTTNEEQAADKKLKAIAEDEVYAQAAAESGSEEGDDTEQLAKQTGSR
jgi:ferritin-like metal-binding protein YciE